MKIGAPKELFENEARVALTPQSAEQLKKLGYECVIESGAGDAARFSDQAYQDAGVEVVEGGAAVYTASDIILKVRAPEGEELEQLRDGQTPDIPSSGPAQNEELLQTLKGKGVTAMPWIWCRGSAGPRRWMPFLLWPILRVTGP